MARESNMSEYVDSHVKLYHCQPYAQSDLKKTHIAVAWAELVSHNPSSSIVDLEST